MEVTNTETVWTGARLALPFGAADFLDGVAFGVIATGIGVGALQAVVFSATAFSGSAQFASLTVLRDDGSLSAVLAAVVALNARYLVFGASVAAALSPNPLRRAGEAQLLTDLSWALSLRGDRVSRVILVGAGAVSLAAWTSGTAAGVLFGAFLGYRAIGLDAALPAFFLCLLLERLASRRAVATAAAGAAAAVALAPIAPAGVPLLVVLAGALAWGSR